MRLALFIGGVMQSGASSNLDEIARLMEQLGQSFDFTEVGEGESFGVELLDAFSTGVFDRTIGEQETPDGNPLAENQGEYGKLKEKRGLPIGIGLAADSTERMLSLVQLKGERNITPDSAEMTYGTDDAAREKASWFTNGSEGSDGSPSGAVNQPERPFWDFNPEMTEQINAMCAAQLERAIKKAGG